MNGGVKFLSCTALLAIAACGGESGKLEVRALATPLAQGKKPVPFRVAEAHGQLALGNVALALEAYRMALREDPNSVDALSGMAVCYDRMGRYDLARRQYEAALAIEPGNPTVLAMLAASLDAAGEKLKAAAVRTEIQQRLAAAATPAQVEARPVTIAAAAPTPVEPQPTVVTALAEAVEIAMPRPGEIPAPVLSAAPLAAGVAIVAPALAVAAAFEEEPKPAPVAAPKPAEQPLAAAETAKIGQTVTVALPAARPVAKISAPAAAPMPIELAEVTPAPAVPLPAPVAAAQKAPAAPVPAPVRTAEQAPVALPQPIRRVAAAGPRLERVSMGEVELVTRAAPRWASLLVKQAPQSATVRFVPLKQYNTRFASVRLLNAAKVAGLAARARSTLFDRGWRNIAIGDAGAVRARSIVLYPNHRRATSLSLARQFGFQSAPRASGREITVLLGRDAVKRRAPAA